jgi:hypothetical protein
MKFYLAIAFAQLMTTAYGFRVKEATTTSDTAATTATTDDSCNTDVHDFGDSTYESTWCDLGGGISTSYSVETYLDGNKTTNNCTYNRPSETTTGYEDTSDCTNEVWEGNNTDPDTCTSHWYSESTPEGDQTSHSTNDCSYVNGTKVGKLTYFI